MADYNDRLEKIVRRARLRKKSRGFFATGAFIDKCLSELFAFYQERGYRIRAVVGMREATKMFYEMVPQFPVSLTSYDKEDTVDWNSFTDEEAVLVIGSFNSSRDVERRFWNKNLNCMILNLYDYFYIRGCEVNTDFWEYRFYGKITAKELKKKNKAYLRHNYFRSRIWYRLLSNFSVSDDFAYKGMWARTFCFRRAFDFLRKDSELKEMYLQRFIFECVKGRDYLTAEKYIRKYVEADYENAGVYQDLLTKWQSMLEEMKTRIQDRRRDDLIVHWLDAMSKERMETTSFLKKLAEENTALENAYTVLPWTTWSMKTIFLETKPIEGELYKYREITADNSSLLSDIEKERYTFRYIGPRIIREKLFSKKYSGCIEMGESEISFTYYYWKMLCLLATERRPLCLWIHELYATHPPYFSPELDELEVGTGENARERQKDISCQYMDRQMEWFQGFLNDNVCQIFMGDHGDTYSIPNYDYLKIRTNIMFVIKNARRAITETDSFFSLENMGRLIRYVMGWSDAGEEELYSDHIIVENFDRYDKGRIDRLLGEQRDKYGDCRNWMQFRAIRTKTDLLVRYANGQVWYFRLPDEETNLVNAVEYRERIEELSDRLGEEFVDIREEDFFRQSRRLYQAQDG